MSKGLIIKKEYAEGCCFDLTDGNGMVLLRSVLFTSEEACQEAMKRLRSETYLVRESEEDRFWFTLRGADQRPLALSPDYAAAYTREKAIKSVLACAGEADIIVPNFLENKNSTGQALRV